MYYVNSQPGINAANTNYQDYTVVPINVFFQRGETAAFMAAPVAVSGTNTDQPSNTPYDFVIQPGQMFGLITSGANASKYGSSVLGLTQTTIASGATTIVLDGPTATELVRRIGTSGTFTLTGPASSATGTVNVQTVTYSAVSLTAPYNVTCTALGSGSLSGSLVQPNDGSQVISTLYANQYSFSVKDIYNVVRTDVTADGFLASGGSAILEDGVFLQIGSGTIPITSSLASYIRAQLTAGIPGIAFRSSQQT